MFKVILLLAFVVAYTAAAALHSSNPENNKKQAVYPYNPQPAPLTPQPQLPSKTAAQPTATYNPNANAVLGQYQPGPIRPQPYYPQFFQPQQAFFTPPTQSGLYVPSQGRFPVAADGTESGGSGSWISSWPSWANVPSQLPTWPSQFPSWPSQFPANFPGFGPPGSGVTSPAEAGSGTITNADSVVVVGTREKPEKLVSTHTIPAVTTQDNSKLDNSANAVQPYYLGSLIRIADSSSDISKGPIANYIFQPQPNFPPQAIIDSQLLAEAAFRQSHISQAATAPQVPPSSIQSQAGQPISPQVLAQTQLIQQALAQMQAQPQMNQVLASAQPLSHGQVWPHVQALPQAQVTSQPQILPQPQILLQPQALSQSLPQAQILNPEALQQILLQKNLPQPVSIQPIAQARPQPNFNQQQLQQLQLQTPQVVQLPHIQQQHQQPVLQVQPLTYQEPQQQHEQPQYVSSQQYSQQQVVPQQKPSAEVSEVPAANLAYQRFLLQTKQSQHHQQAVLNTAPKVDESAPSVPSGPAQDGTSPSTAGHLQVEKGSI